MTTTPTVFHRPDHPHEVAGPARSGGHPARGGRGRLRVLHVTEAMAGGIQTVLMRLSMRQVEAGADVSVTYLSRAESPSDEALRSAFHQAVELRRVRAAGGHLARMAATFRAVRSALAEGEYDAVHLHSTYAGFAGRLAALTVRSRTPLLYSPHGLSFLRASTPAVLRSLMWAAEAALGRIGTFVAISDSELRTARRSLRPRRAFLLRNGVDTIDAQFRIAHGTSNPPIVAMVGRVTQQKAPWRFAAVATELADLARFVWIGDGPQHEREQWLGAAPVEVTGWLDKDQMAEHLSDVTVLLFPTSWEGMPMSVMEAQACGVPAVVSDIVGNWDVVEHGVTGYVADSDAELASRVRDLLTDPDLRQRMSDAAIDYARAELSDEGIGRQSLHFYRSIKQVRSGR